MKLLETTEQSFEIEKLINNSIEFLIILSPYLKINNRLKARFQNCFSKVDHAIFLYREDHLLKEDRNSLTASKNVILLPIRNLHAKCYLNESTALITSMNLYEYSQVNNHEIGVMLNRASDKKEFAELLRFIRQIIKTDYPTFDFNQYTSLRITYRMGDLYNELSKNYTFPVNVYENDAVYHYICNIARRIHRFNFNELYEDKSAILRSTVISESLYFHLLKTISASGKRK